MNKFKKIMLVVLITTSLSAISQNKEDALSDAKITSKATLEMDFKTVLKHTLPKVVSMMGGEDAALTLLKSTFESMASQGFVFEKADIISVSDIVEEQGQYRCVIEGYNQMKMANQRIKSKSYLLGIYNSDEGYWWFVEAKQLKNQAMIDVVLPNFETKLDIPDDDVQLEQIED